MSFHLSKTEASVDLTSWTLNLQKPLDTLKDRDNTKGIKWMENWVPNANSRATKDDFKTRIGSAKWGKKELGHLGQEGTVWALHDHNLNLCPLSCPPVYLIFTVGCVLLCILQPLPPPLRPGSCSVHRSAGIAPVWDSFPMITALILLPPDDSPVLCLFRSSGRCHCACWLHEPWPYHCKQTLCKLFNPPSALLCVSCRDPVWQISSEWKGI